MLIDSSLMQGVQGQETRGSEKMRRSTNATVWRALPALLWRRQQPIYDTEYPRYNEK